MPDCPVKITCHDCGATAGECHPEDLDREAERAGYRNVWRRVEGVVMAVILCEECHALPRW